MGKPGYSGNIKKGGSPWKFQGEEVIMKKNLMIGIKVCREERNLEELYWSVIPLCGATVSYGIGKKSRPRHGCGPLTIFKNVDAATKFYLSLAGRDSLVLLLCQYRPSRSISVWYSQGGKEVFSLVCTKNGINPDEADLASSIVPIGKIPRRGEI